MSAAAHQRGPGLCQPPRTSLPITAAKPGCAMHLTWCQSLVQSSSTEVFLCHRSFAGLGAALQQQRSLVRGRSAGYGGRGSSGGEELGGRGRGGRGPGRGRGRGDLAGCRQVVCIAAADMPCACDALTCRSELRADLMWAASAPAQRSVQAAATCGCEGLAHRGHRCCCRRQPAGRRGGGPGGAGGARRPLPGGAAALGAAAARLHSRCAAGPGVSGTGQRPPCSDAL